MTDDQTYNQFQSDRLSEYQLESIVGGAGMISVNYPCDICGEAFKTAELLTQHTSTKHR